MRDALYNQPPPAILTKRPEISCAKRREIVLDGLIAASMRQIFAPETSGHSAIIVKLPS
jgi:hypothetical protein